MLLLTNIMIRVIMRKTIDLILRSMRKTELTELAV